MTTTQSEQRASARPLEIRQDHDDAPARLVGYAALFNAWSEDLGGFVERVAPGAFSAAIERDDVRALVNHDRSIVIGRRAAGTLVLAEDEIGLRTEITPPDTSHGRDLVVSVRRGDVTGMSFAFRAVEDEWENLDGTGGPARRTLREVALQDVSVVTYPAYSGAEVALRAALEQRRPELEAARARARAQHARRLRTELAARAV